MLYGTSQAITEYINQGDPYAKVKRCILLISFILIWGREMITCITGTGVQGIHTKDVLRLSVQQQEQFVCHDAEIYSRSIT